MSPESLIASAFGLSVTEFAALLIGAGYVISLARDWRPVRTLRSENRELREAAEAAAKKTALLETKVKTLEHATDLTVLQREHQQFAETMQRVVETLDRLDSAVRANTTAVEALARDSHLKRALEE